MSDPSITKANARTVETLAGHIYVGRTFIAPGQNYRLDQVKIKLFLCMVPSAPPPK